MAATDLRAAAGSRSPVADRSRARRTLATVETPAGVVDLPRVRRNVKRVARYCRQHGIAWRPHVKTHKSVEMARLQLGSGAVGLTVATPHEAEVMAGVTDDILVAHPPADPSKVARLCALPSRVDLKVALDSPDVLRPLCAAAAAAGRTVGILVEIDVGANRTGVVDPANAVRLARAVKALSGGRFDGLLFYPGIRKPRGAQDHDLNRLAARLDACLTALDLAGLPPRIVSGGSTPTLWDSHRLPGVTEVRPGTSIYNDRDIVSMGACESGDVAYSVLATVISTAVPGQAVVDAGSKAISKELLGSGAPGFGVLLDRPGVVVAAANEEHGMIDLAGARWRPSVGDRVRIVPNHVCVSVNLQDQLWGFEKAAGPLRRIALEGRGRGRWPTDGRT